MQSALQDLKSAISRVRDIAADIAATTPQALKNPQLLQRHNTIQCACPVLLSGYFETFLKNLAEAFVIALYGQGTPFLQLPNKIQKHHFLAGASLIVDKLKNRGTSRWITATHEDIALRLSSVCDPTLTYELVWEAFANTRSNPGPDVVKEFLLNFGVENVSDKFNQFANPGWAWNNCSAQLASFMAVRHECAHTGSSSTSFVPTNIQSYCDLIENISETIVKLLDNHLTTI
jgi:RiboL-PSP-HEPN